jgi:hypothetical protein
VKKSKKNKIPDSHGKFRPISISAGLRCKKAYFLNSVLNHSKGIKRN